MLLPSISRRQCRRKNKFEKSLRLNIKPCPSLPAKTISQGAKMRSFILFTREKNLGHLGVSPSHFANPNTLNTAFILSRYPIVYAVAPPSRFRITSHNENVWCMLMSTIRIHECLIQVLNTYAQLALNALNIMYLLRCRYLFGKPRMMWEFELCW